MDLISNRSHLPDGMEKATLIEELTNDIWVGDGPRVAEHLKKDETILAINQPNSRGQTALYTAARKGHFDILAQLLNYRYTDIDVQTQTGSTALHGLYTVVFVLTLPAAAYFAMPECAAMLLISGADLTIKNQHTLTPSQEANGMSCKVIDIWEKHRPYEAIERLRTLYPAMYVVPKEDLAMLDIRGRLKVRELAVKPNAAG